MNLIFTILLIVSLIVVLLFAVALKVMFSFNTDKANMNLTLLWLYPFLKAVVTSENAQLLLTIYLFNKSVIRKTLNVKPKDQKRKTSQLDLIRKVNPEDVNLHATYGFRDPFITGVACGAISIVSQFINIESIDQHPDFAADKDYIYVDATAEVNLGTALLNLYKARRDSLL